MVKTNKKLALILSLVMLLLAFGSVLAISSLSAHPMQTIEASTLSEADIAYRRANPGLYETGTATLIKSWQELLKDDFTMTNGNLKIKEESHLAGDLICGPVGGLTSLSQAFSFPGFENTYLTLIDLSNLDTSNVTNMSMMFDGCINLNNDLTSIDLSMLDTSKVEDMSGMFFHSGFKTIKFGGKFVTTNVKSMRYMFDASSVISLDLSSFDTRNVTDMRYMFGCITTLGKLDLSNFVISSSCLTDNMFSSAYAASHYFFSLNETQIATYFKADTVDQRLEVFKEKFGGEDALNQLYNQLGGEDAFIKTFCSDSQINELITPQMASGKTTKFVFPEKMFYVEKNDSSNTAVPALNSTTNGKTLVLKTIKGDPSVPTTDGSDVGLFKNGKQVKSWTKLLSDEDITITNGLLQVVNKDLEGDLVCDNVDGVTRLTVAFANCTKLTSLDLRKLDTSGVTDMTGVFYGCSFKTLNLSGKFVIPSDCAGNSLFSNPALALASSGFPEEKIEDVLAESSPDKRLELICTIMGVSIDEMEAAKKDPEMLMDYYYMITPMLYDSTICEIVLPTSVSGKIALAPISGQHYAYTSTSEAIDKLEASSGSNTKLTLYKDATNADAEAEPVPFPTTPSGTSETGVVANVSMVVIALVSVIGLAVVLTKKKRMAR